MRTVDDYISPRIRVGKSKVLLEQKQDRSVNVKRPVPCIQIAPTDFSRSSSQQKLESIEAKMQNMETKLRIIESKNTKLEFELYKLKERQAMLEEFIDDEVSAIVWQVKQDRNYWREKALASSRQKSKMRLWLTHKFA